MLFVFVGTIDDEDDADVACGESGGGFIELVMLDAELSVPGNVSLIFSNFFFEFK